MATNFDFLKTVDKNLFEIITEAEKLYRDEYFEQCMSQTRRFGEHVCKNVLGKNRTSENTFDEMLATLKDKANGAEQEKEFINDLYFLKKQGNASVHSSKVKKDGMTALECLQRAFEVAVNYAVYNKKGKQSILKLRYDTELLVTGKRSKKSLTERYLEEKDKAKTFTKRKTVKTKASKKQVSSMKSKTNEQKGFPIYWIIVGISFIAACIVMVMSIL
ncbi:hypothetical protein HDR58_09995 [bacterium]|nr:hypothetical protein [bacterium]